MASEQRGARKKQSKNLSRGENCHPVLYRHQDCIPNQKLLQNCERLNIRNNQDLEYHGKSGNEQETNDLKNKSKQLNSKIKNGEKSENNFQKSTLNLQQPNEIEGNNEELSKSRKRRLRKQRLLVSLAPSSSKTKPNPSEAKSLQIKSVSQPIARPITVTTPTPTASNNKTSELPKPSAKDSRKRLDKIVGSRNKSIKTKSLAENTYQSRTDIIKTLEEKTLNSLLQTLAPLTNSSPKKEKTSIPLFSFPEKRLNPSGNKVDRDGVFYFGETKNQLEKLTSESSKYNTSPVQENPEVAPNVEFNRNADIGSKQNNFENCDSSLNFCTPGQETLNTSTTLKQNLYETKSKRAFSLSDSRKKDLSFETPVLKDLSQFPIRVLNLTKSPMLSSPTSVTNNPGVFEKSIEKTDKITKPADNTPCICDTTVSLLEEETKPRQTNSLDVLRNNQSVVNSMEETNKSNKTREDVMLEREAKKAVKLAAKAKYKTAQLSKTSNSNNKTSQLEEKANSQDQKDVKSEKRDTQPNIRTQSFSKERENNVQNEQVASNDKLCLSSQNKEKPHSVKIAISPEDLGTDLTVKSKAELKAERRAKQEAQRAAKTTSKVVQAKPKEKVSSQVKPEQLNKVATIEVEAERKAEVVKTPSQPKPKLFSHLYQEKTLFTSNEVLKVGGLHPAIVRLGVQYAARVVVGSNARCVALLHALKQMVNDYTTPLDKEFSRGLEEELSPVTLFLNQCRPLAVSMTNALRHIKRTLTQLPNSISDIEARRKICDVVDTYIHEQVDVAGKAICNTVKQKIANGDVILTYGCSSLIYQILVESHLSGTKFRVVVVDGLPWREGREMLRRLVEKGLSCTYVLITAASFIMREASKVLLGAHALLANGYVMSRAGSSQMALIAHCYNVPVLVCCETHKFCERVQTDAFVYNELGELCCDNIKEKDKGRVLTSLTPMSLAYDITPPDLVSAVVTELAVLPCTSVPVILRIKPSESVM